MSRLSKIVFAYELNVPRLSERVFAYAAKRECSPILNIHRLSNIVFAYDAIR